MNQQEKKQFFENFNKSLHIIGKITVSISILLFLLIPIVVGFIYHASPDLGSFWSGFAKVAVIYYPVAIVEFLVYTPMLGVGGSYLAFITGNVTNMKIPCVMNSKDITDTPDGTPESEIVSTLSVATSAITTTVVVALGVILIIPLKPVLENPVLLPAFNNVVPALFGALGLKYFIKEPKITAIPLAAMILLCTLVPAMISQTSILILPAGGLAIGIAYLLHKKGKL
ncbi:hypothetical protein M2145_000943 [Lachnospiraceae bacterium PF1-21]|uniref:Uncharacterized protein n=1 Tax=Ohessyouella blattaphilus TaxID=2949333 RepID=A0ABT1EID7_9FIRM|nr:hypothetical protein [Ohessyouella blattaphilus]MCP1110467.1 hypothetical protein [Ohessyouella blattaphilus]MCR8563861.1 hypothetical protein [Ohessyouella blattaphilus]